MPLDPRTPVIVGVAQSLRRPSAAGLDALAEPVDMMADALRVAADDSGAGAVLLERAGSVQVVDVLSWRYAEPARLLAERVGAEPRETVRTTTGGNSPQMLVNRAAECIQRGEVDVCLIAGAEAVYTRLLARKAKHWLPWTPQAEPVDGPGMVGDSRPGSSDLEMAHGLLLPTQVYPLFENALRGAAGESIEHHQRRVSEVWSRFSEVASTNPHAWSPQPRSAEEIRTVTPDNRMVGYPYPKLMNSNLQTDQAAALILCSAAAAGAAGVPRDRWVFPLAGAEGHDHWFVSERADLHSSPAIAAAGRALAAATGVAPSDCQHIDLYSCFPSAVQIGAAALGLPVNEADRPLTVTGGLCFAGGPGNNYATHAIATMVERLRGRPGEVGLVTALGWYVTKHALGLYSAEPPGGGGFLRSTVQPEVDRLPGRRVDAGHQGAATVESYTVMHERDGTPAVAIAACLTPAGARTWATSRDAGLLAAMTSEEFCGRPVAVRDATLVAE